MGKRSNFKRHKGDFYPTPLDAVRPLIPHLNGVRRFAEPCCGDGRLVRHMESFGLRCVYSGDIATGQDALARDDYGAPDKIITNPPFSHPLLHQLISHFVRIAPTWLLPEMGFATNKRDVPLLAACTDIVPIGRVRWIEGTKFNSCENFGWFHFRKDHSIGPWHHLRGVAPVVNGHSRTCEQCGRPFHSIRSDSRTCSATCRQRAHRQRIRDIAVTSIDAAADPAAGR
jgi:hypothetical protein